MTKVLIVGGGLTSAVTACLLSQSNKFVNSELSVWDKARGSGGRMSTSRLTTATNSTCSADLGAQYITATPDYAKLHSEYYNELKTSNILSPLNLPIEGQKPNAPGTIDYVCPNGSSSIVKHFFKKSAVDIKFGKRVSSLKNNENNWIVTTESGDTERFDAVILTMPAPQILELLSNSHVVDASQNQDFDLLTSKLQNVTYSSRYAIALLYESNNENDETTIKNKINFENGSCAKYIYGDEIFRYVSLDNYKRHNTLNPPVNDLVPMSVVFHTSVPFGVEHVEKSPEDVKPILLNHIERLFPDWPKPSQVKCQKWRYSQVQNSYPEKPGSIELLKTPLLLAGGDAFTHSNFDGCITSAEAIVEKYFANGQ